MSAPWPPPSPRGTVRTPGRSWFVIAGTALAVCTAFLVVLLWLITGWSALDQGPRPVWLEILSFAWPPAALSALCWCTAAHPRVWTAWPATAVMVAVTAYSWQLGGVPVFLVCLVLTALCLVGAVSVTVAWRRGQS